MAQQERRPLTNVDCRKTPASASTEDKLDRGVAPGIQNHDRETRSVSLYFRYHRRFARFLTDGPRNYADAEEIINDTSMDCWEKRGCIFATSHAVKWIMGIALQMGRKSPQRPRDTSALATRARRRRGDRADALQETEETPDALAGRLQTLPHRTAPRLSSPLPRPLMRGGRSPAAKIMECPVPPTTVKARMFRARRK